MSMKKLPMETWLERWRMSRSASNARLPTERGYVRYALKDEEQIRREAAAARELMKEMK